ncbi:hypothetical protein MMC17_001820 [Xylographa soralifera]|nr:hypothetical protein [Xylographa soralifera]
MKGRQKDLRASIRSLPKELRDMIQKEYIRAVLQPGRVYPGIPDSKEKIPGNTLAIRPGVVEALQIQDASIRRLARDIFYTQNTWVVAEGPYSTISFLDQPSAPVIFDISRIISIDFSFSCRDTNWILEDKPDFLRRKRQYWYSKLWKGTYEHDARTLQEYNTMYQEWRWHIQDCWRDKFGLISRLPLHHLRLDFRNCYEPSGRFRGFDIVNSPSTMFFPFGLPPHLEVVSGNPLTEGFLLRHLSRWTPNEPQRVTECSFCINGLHPTDRKESR